VKHHWERRLDDILHPRLLVVVSSRSPAEVHLVADHQAGVVGQANVEEDIDECLVVAGVTRVQEKGQKHSAH